MIHVLYYLGGLVAIAAMTVLMNIGWTQFGGWGLVALACSYAVIGLYLMCLLCLVGLDVGLISSIWPRFYLRTVYFFPLY